ncbi:hypothetical protein N8I77_011927 [Diaporthe amygdali]|uniref:Uncharacterized protein n=1 Tax=Phomopsis amygdali TaxID=1214568 RepID=A0AAD9S3N7_PHOAM|nr:hypothetical protein N8I77_011927 [Diaporthe amygdali]
MIMSAQNRGRPSLEINTDYAGPSDVRLRSAFRKHRSPLPSATPITPKTLPSPIQPSTPAYDMSMRQHERAMVESLEARGGLSRSLSPVAEQSMSTRVNMMTMDSPVQSRTAAHPLTAPNTPLIASLSHGRQNMVQQTRSMLLSGMSPSQASNVGAVSNRKLSAPAEAIQRQRRQAMMLLQPDMLQAWGHVYLGDPTKADVLVAPSALRRLSGTEQPDSAGEGNGQSERLFIRVRVRPKGKERKPFLIARSFSLNELRATLPSPATPVRSPRRQAVAPLSPDTISSPRPSTLPLAPSRRRSTVASSSPMSSRSSHQHRSGSREVPIHLPYARAYLPALAAVMLSGHVKTGDTIDLPMPHPEAWTQTVAYAYTGRGEATEVVKQNMLHLGGRV